MPLTTHPAARYTCHITTPNGVSRPPVQVTATDRRDAARQALANFPRGSRAACRLADSQTRRVADLLAARIGSFPVIGAVR